MPRRLGSAEQGRIRLHRLSAGLPFRKAKPGQFRIKHMFAVLRGVVPGRDKSKLVQNVSSRHVQRTASRNKFGRVQSLCSETDDGRSDRSQRPERLHMYERKICG